MCDIKELIAEEKADKWWEDFEKKSQSQEKWKVLKHNGVYFPPPYEPLPSSVKLLYKGSPVSISKTDTNNPFNVTAEEAVVFLAQRMEQDDRLGEKDKKRKKSINDSKFMENFWNDWKIILGKDSVIKDISKVDFSPIRDYVVKRSQERKSSRSVLSVEEKEDEKERKEEIKKLYGYAVVDDIKIPLGNYTVQPPGLYIGHGNQPLRGKIKSRIKPSDITLNISKKFVPKCYVNDKPCNWGNVVERRDVAWIAQYRNPITKELVHVYLKREESHWVCSDDQKKFDKARNLNDNIENVRNIYTRDLSSNDKILNQLATAVYLLDKLAIRPGTEKDEEKEADTVGLTTLKIKNIKFLGNKKIKLKFVGKSSIEFEKDFKVSSKVYENLETLAEDKKENEDLFPNVNSNSLNEYLKKLLPGTTAKVFRTWKASSTLYNMLKEDIPSPELSVQDKKFVYDSVNIEVAKVLNHKRMGVGDDRIKKLEEKKKELEKKQKEAKTDKQKEAIRKRILVNDSKIEEASQNISMATSKQNYLDPRISVVWCKKADMPIEKIYSKPQLKKFIWAMETPMKWEY
jgi:DNA topoisomerase-1